MSEEKAREDILAAARELYGRAVWTHKVHEKEREIWSQKTCTVNQINIALGCLTTLLAILSTALETKWFLLVLTALSAVTTTGFVLWVSNFDPVGKENRHRVIAKEMLCMRESLFLLIVRCHVATDSVENLGLALDRITRELTTTYKFAVDTSPEAYKLASDALKSGEYTFGDDEIDSLLPSRFRKARTPGSQ